MIELKDIITVVVDIVKEYLIPVIVVSIIGGYFIWNKIKKRRELKMKFKQNISGEPIQKIIKRPAHLEQPVREDPVPKPSPVAQPISSFGNEGSMSELFNLHKNDSERDNSSDVIDKVDGLGTDLIKESEDVANRFKQDFEKLRAELVETNKKREQIRNAGLKLSDLFDKYRQREVHLTQMLANLDDLIKKNENTKL